jgi:hypothetical protein
VAPRRSSPAAAGATVSGSIDALFSGAGASNTDVNAATTLADAFASDGPETSQLKGVPAHRASSELSLDHVFRAATPAQGTQAASNFSFDQFFSEGMSDTAPAASGDPSGAHPQTPDDIAQFNAWLNGLKKT